MSSLKSWSFVSSAASISAFFSIFCFPRLAYNKSFLLSSLLYFSLYFFISYITSIYSFDIFTSFSSWAARFFSITLGIDALRRFNFFSCSLMINSFFLKSPKSNFFLIPKLEKSSFVISSSRLSVSQLLSEPEWSLCALTSKRASYLADYILFANFRSFLKSS